MKRPTPAPTASESQPAIEAGDVKLSLIEEMATVKKQDVVTGRVRVTTHVETFEEIAEYDLQSEVVDVIRVPVDRLVEGPLPQTED